jgi:hypothetical protein
MYLRKKAFNTLGAVDPATAAAIAAATYPTPPNTGGADAQENLTYAINQQNALIAQLTAGYVAPQPVVNLAPVAAPTAPAPTVPGQPVRAPMPTSPAATVPGRPDATSPMTQGLVEFDPPVAGGATYVPGNSQGAAPKSSGLLWAGLAALAFLGGGG